ncbi:DUF2807 domain-containing protein [Zymomonas sp.]|uniref:GIN domain-containing protein n=1 Tax=Zymomonas sp. TaxID=2068624 RepID=UPI0025F3A9CB|nr:DUF2807 domain-containing protein [Zymomonas sp.]MCA1955724.1 DUF2807 domain-containing protein [Zymomonas sp.]
MRDRYKIGCCLFFIIAAFAVITVKVWPSFSGRIDQSYHFQPFDTLYLAGIDDAEIILGDDYSVNLQVAPKAVKSLDIEFKNNSLNILYKKNWLNYLDFHKSPVKIRITLPVLKEFVSSGTGFVSIEGKVRNPLTVILNGSGKINISSDVRDNLTAILNGSGAISFSDIHADKVVSDIMGSGQITFAGDSRSATLRLMGSGKMDISKFQSQIVNLSLMGSGDIDVKPDADMSRWKISKMGSGNIRQQKAIPLKG